MRGHAAASIEGVFCVRYIRARWPRPGNVLRDVRDVRDVQSRENKAMSWWKRWIGGRVAPRNAVDAAPKESGAVELRAGTFEFERWIARNSLEMVGELAHGAQHLGNLLLMAPTDADSLALAGRYAHKAGSGAAETLLPPEQQRYAGPEALRAWLWRRDGRLEEATELVVEIVQSEPEGAGRLSAWLLEWLEPAGAIESLSVGLQMRLAKAMLTQSSEARLSSARRLWSMQRWARVLARIAPPDEFQAQWRMLRIGFLRRAGLFDDALRLAGPLAAASDWHVATAIGLVLRQQRRMPEAEQAFRRAIAFDPQELSTFLEMADGWLENQDWAQALQGYDHVLAQEADHDWAQASQWYCQWKLTGDAQWIDRVLAAAQAGNARAQRLWHTAFDRLPDPEDASANTLRKLLASLRAAPPAGNSTEPSRPNRLSMSLSSIEAPSNALAFTLALAALDQPVTLTVRVDGIPHPDPREPAGPVAHSLWRYDGTDASPALPAPAPEVLERIAGLARMPYEPDANWAAASHAALALGPASGQDRSLEVLACMVHPPALPAGTEALAWLPRVQMVAAQVLAQVDEGWQGSRRRELLLCAMLGPADWSTCAAIRALAWIGRREPAHMLDIHQCFERLEAHRPDSGYCCWIATLYEQWLVLPLLFDRERETLRVKLAQLSDDE
jgi:tetratricopeptide (TPR) repeat protein